MNWITADELTSLWYLSLIQKLNWRYERNAKICKPAPIYIELVLDSTGREKILLIKANLW